MVLLLLLVTVVVVLPVLEAGPYRDPPVAEALRSSPTCCLARLLAGCEWWWEYISE